MLAASAAIPSLTRRLTHEEASKDVDWSPTDLVQQIHRTQHRDQCQTGRDERVGERLVPKADRNIEDGSVLGNEGLADQHCPRSCSYLTRTLLCSHCEYRYKGTTKIGAPEQVEPSTFFRRVEKCFDHGIDFDLAQARIDVALRSDTLQGFYRILASTMENQPPWRIGQKWNSAEDDSWEYHGDANWDHPTGRISVF